MNQYRSLGDANVAGIAALDKGLELLGFRKALRKAMDVVQRYPASSRKVLHGLVRASVGLKNARDDIDRLALALNAVGERGRSESPGENQ